MNNGRRHPAVFKPVRIPRLQASRWVWYFCFSVSFLIKVSILCTTQTVSAKFVSFKNTHTHTHTDTEGGRDG